MVSHILHLLSCFLFVHMFCVSVLQWSDAVSLIPCSGRLLTLSGLPDLCMSVVKRGFTVHIVLMHASHTEILAVDIRGQLSKEYMQRGK